MCPRVSQVEKPLFSVGKFTSDVGAIKFHQNGVKVLAGSFDGSCCVFDSRKPGPELCEYVFGARRLLKLLSAYLGRLAGCHFGRFGVFMRWLRLRVLLRQVHSSRHGAGV